VSSFQGTITDLIDTHNRFYGAQFGMSYDWKVAGKVFVNGFAKVALGDMRETFSLRGFTQQLIPDGARPNNPSVATFPGGQFVGALDNNTERHFDRICVIPEVNFNVGYELTQNIRAHVGYNWLYISALARPVEQLTVAQSSTAVSIGQNTGSVLGGSPQNISVFSPSFKVHNDQAWIYGINMGIDIRY